MNLTKKLQVKFDVSPKEIAQMVSIMNEVEIYEFVSSLSQFGISNHAKKCLSKILTYESNFKINQNREIKQESLAVAN